MTRSLLAASTALITALAFAPGCTVMGDPGDAELIEIEGVSEGAQLFNKGTFAGNGTTCKTCHTMKDNGNTGTLSPAQVQALFASNPNDVLFQHDRADVIGGDTFDRLRTHATILIDRALPSNVRLVGSSARSVILARGIPTVMNTPSMDSVFMYDGRDPTLQIQAQGAIRAHAQGGTATGSQLNSIAAFQQTLFNRENVEEFAQGGGSLSMPLGTTDSERRGRRFFIDEGLTDMDSVGQSLQAACGWCHSGNALNTTSAFFEGLAGIPTGSPFATALVSELNPLGNPVYTFDVTVRGGPVQRLSSPDPGVMLTNGDPAWFNIFKTPTLWGVEDTAPYFHDNSSKSLEELSEHYDVAMFLITGGLLDLTDQDKADIVAYLKLL